MSNVQLLPHNEEAYEKLINTLQDHQMVSVNHATGTGKSFIILKYLEENKDKRILFAAPTYPIIDQLFEEHMDELGLNKEDFNKLDGIIYRNFLSKNMEQLAKEYDIIILDEYHRCGAKKWGEKVNELLDIIKKEYPTTKVIGTTATEIRYLDNEKNMNNILFDGVCASRLSLADAILKGILPIPSYVSAVYNLLEEVDKIEKRIYKKAFYKDIMKPYLEQISDIKKKIYEGTQNLKNIRSQLGKKGKYLVFSSEIDDIYKNIDYIQELFGDDYGPEFIVHSAFSKEHNKDCIKKFREDINGNAFLYSINILNEGLHVKDVDAIFMMRKTTSPIIYFQQLGRLLSYSRRKKEVVVFDLVNNIKNNPFIYNLYQEVVIRARELIETDPENKEHYQEILNKFKVVNLTSDICEQIDRLKETASVENLKRQRINMSVEILEGKRNATEFERIQAYVDLFKYKHSIELELFRRIKKLNIPKPEIFMLSENEFLEYTNDPKVQKKYDKEHSDSDKFGIGSNLVFQNEFERVLNICDDEFKQQKFSSRKEYIENLYSELVSFINENGRQPKAQKKDESFALENELFYKMIIFQKDLEDLNFAQNLRDLVIKINEQKLIDKLMKFVQTHPESLASIKSQDSKERELAIEIKNIEEKLSSENLDKFLEIKKQAIKNQRDIVVKYVKFLNSKKRYPLLNATDLEEQELAVSFSKITVLTDEEKKLVDRAVLNINKRTMLKNSYLALQEKKRLQMEQRTK